MFFREYTIPVELVAYFPIDDTSGFALHTEANHLYVRKILFNFASGFFDDISEKQLLIEDCEKIKHTDTISFLVEIFSKSLILIASRAIILNWQLSIQAQVDRPISVALT